MLEKEQKIIYGLEEVVLSARRYGDSFPQKLRDAHNLYLNENPELYVPEDVKKLGYYIEVFSYKFYLSSMYSEQLEALVFLGDDKTKLVDILKNIFDQHSARNNRVLLYSFILEGFLLQSATFLEFYMLYVGVLFQFSDIKSMSKQKFLSRLKELDKESVFAEKALQDSSELTHFQK